MLASLQSYDKKEAANVVAALALASVPNPGEEVPDLVKKYESFLPPIEKEIRGRLKLDEDDTSFAANSRYHAEVANLLTSVLLSDKDETAIIARAGQAGRLAPSQYVVQLSGLNPDVRALGVRPAHIQDAITHADDVQHLRVQGAPEEKPFSIFMRFIRPRRDGDSFWLCVYSQRLGNVQIVQHAWRVYVDDVDLRGAKVPLDVLRAFTSVFGTPVSVGTIRSALVSDIVVPVSPGDTLQMHVDSANPMQTHFTTFSTTQLSDPPRVYISIAFAIDLRKYAKSLIAHKVEVSRELLRRIGSYQGR
jgi:hypothetical protein